MSLPEHLVSLAETIEPGDQAVITAALAEVLIESHRRNPRDTHLFQRTNGLVLVYRVTEV